MRLPRDLPGGGADDGFSSKGGSGIRLQIWSDGRQWWDFDPMTAVTFSPLVVPGSPPMGLRFHGLFTPVVTVGNDGAASRQGVDTSSVTASAWIELDERVAILDRVPVAEFDSRTANGLDLTRFLFGDFDCDSSRLTYLAVGGLEISFRRL